MQPAGAGAAAIAPLAWLLIAIAAGVCLLVVILIVAGGARRRGRSAEHALAETGGGTMWIQLGGILIPVIILAAVFVLSERTLSLIPGYAHAATRAAPLPTSDSTPTIEVTGRQWWWQVRYRSAGNAGAFTTANEIHLPVGRPVRILIRSVDVNHSFWIPQLHPKEDAIPGRVNTILVRADRPGTYRGECSEFCGQEHARMAFTVVAESPARYAEWVAHESQDARTPPGGEAARGQAAFLDNACAFCHAIRGTMAGGAVAPDLTHIASRPTLAAGTVANSRPMLEGWIMNAPAMKPGTQMPAFPQLDAATLRGLIAYLETLR
jgi:cytochrome c oxidase subunit II